MSTSFADLFRIIQFVYDYMFNIVCIKFSFNSAQFGISLCIHEIVKHTYGAEKTYFLAEFSARGEVREGGGNWGLPIFDYLNVFFSLKKN